ncbi:hypothetical protein SAMN06265795_11965 [Noviherbaspirillum humi]|uniref:Uncharacterized protein n=1 Tax=Noviherbaspirillum humi TaxID=1688639 RepID=A0A239L7T0_9BURK|nr:hypothetical protein [Noviherbaspirillum humi]SNT25584.1 hypothetical protein SAMN06265795_11965 [Noviherbaspirillum humi]
MSISVQQLEQLLSRLQHLKDELGRNRAEPQRELAQDDPLVRMADDCDFLLPSPLTVRNLAETVERKIGNVHVLLDRARENADIPQDIQAAADNEDMLVQEPGQRQDGPPRGGLSA